MGYYIQTPWPRNKAHLICEAVQGAVIVEEPKRFSDVPEGKGLVCVVDNGPFEAAAFCYSEAEFKAFKEPDGRSRKWVLLDRKTAEELSGYKGK